MRGYLKALVLLFHLVQVSRGGKQAATERLVAKVKAKRELNVLVAPNLDGESPLDVYASVHFNSVLGLNIKEQTLTCTGILTSQWTDHRLAWDPSDYDNVTRIYIPRSMVWIPDIVLFNVIGTKDDDRTRNGGGNTLLTVYANGSVLGELNFKVDFICKADVTKYPFDTNVCPVVILPWVSDVTRMNFDYDEHSFYTMGLIDNGEFQISLDSIEKTTVQTVFEFNQLTIHVKLVRRPTFVIINIFFFSMLGPTSFLLGPDQHDKLALAITSLLSVTVFLSTVDSVLPKSADSVSLLTIYVCCIVCHSFLTVMGNVLAILQWRSSSGRYPQDGGDGDDTVRTSHRNAPFGTSKIQPQPQKIFNLRTNADRVKPEAGITAASKDDPNPTKMRLTSASSSSFSYNSSSKDAAEKTESQNTEPVLEPTCTHTETGNVSYCQRQTNEDEDKFTKAKRMNKIFLVASFTSSLIISILFWFCVLAL